MTTPLQIEVDTELSVGYVTFARGEVARTVALSDCLNIDLDESGSVLGLELLSLSAALPQQRLIDEFHLDEEFITKLGSGFFG
jgi:uncharacterized protein YuzE